MKKLLLLIFIAASAIAQDSDPEKQAVAFNKWYVKQINEDKFPITDSHEIDKYVTASTMKKLRRTQEANYSDDPFYDADIFTKSQYIGDDWADFVTVVAGDTDPVCVNVYIEFGKKKKHTVIDCMVKEDGFWKVQSVAARDFN